MLEGFRSPMGIAVAPEGTVFFTAEKEGSLFQLYPDGTFVLLEDHLKRPRGLVRGEDGTLFFVAEGQRGRERGPRPRGLLLGRSPAGTTTVLVSGLDAPQHLALAPDGSLLLSAAGGLRESPATGEEDEDDDREGTREDGARSSRPSPWPGTVLRVTRGGQILQNHPGFRRPAGLAGAADGTSTVAAEGFRSGGPGREGSLFGMDPAGQVTLFLPERFRTPRGLVQESLGHFYLAVGAAPRGQDEAAEQEGWPPHKGLLLKVAPDGTFTRFAHGLAAPWGLALDPAGHLYVTDSEAGRIYRFLAPAAPTLAPLPAATNHPAVTLAGTAGPEARITARGGTAEATTLADADGQFALEVPLSLDRESRLTVYATAAGGAGLTGAPATTTIVQDGTPPAVAFVSPTEGSRLAGVVPVEITAEDALSGIAQVELLVDGARSASRAEPPFTFPLDAALLAPGAHTLTAVAVDRAGNQAAVSTTVSVSSLFITITAPADGASVPSGLLVVRGRVEGEDAEVGVLVNGVVAAVEGSTFAALVPVTPSTTALTALATGATGASASHTITLTVTPAAEPLLELQPSPASGVAPLTVFFSLLGGPVPASVALDLEDDGTPEFIGASLEERPFTYSQPGLYLPTVTVTDPQGQRHMARAVVQVSERAALDTQLQARWTALRDALGRGDVSGAVEVFAQSSREAYREQFTALAAVGALGQVATDLGGLTLLRVREGAAEYDLRAVRNGIEYSFHVLFVIDADGLWRLWAF